MHEVEIFFANFQILGPLGCQGWVVIPQNVKKVKITVPYRTLTLLFQHNKRILRLTNETYKINIFSHEPEAKFLVPDWGI